MSKTYDPNRSLADALRAARAFMVEEDYDDLTSKLETISAELLNLDEWIRRGGHLPEAWAT